MCFQYKTIALINTVLMTIKDVLLKDERDPLLFTWEIQGA